MIKVLQLLFSPVTTWEKIAEKNRNFATVLAIYVIPLLLISCVGEGYGLIRWGEKRGEFDHLTPVTQQLALRYELCQGALNLLVIFLGAQLLLSVARSFHLITTYSQAFNAVAYGFGPLFAVQLLDGIPAINTWILWAIGVVLSMTILYHGVALVLKPDQTKGFGIYLTTILFMLVFSGLSHFIAWSILHEKILKSGIPQLGL